MSEHFSMEARVGRDRQRYTADEYREVVGTVPVDMATGKLLLISSRKHPGQWVIPKGGWDDDETREDAAVRETWEEAGVEGTLGPLILSHRKTSNKTGAKEKGTHVQIYELYVSKVAQEWPESGDRQRQWMRYEEALALIKGFVLEAVQQCSLSPGGGVE
ncbi:NUDIX hydrolase domain-like protein [Piptocephalis cylindrospora]|uniref:NUDIX hydrolase domain-like protein n=1 Tax=Piptocephalis cylindrospora TaxID=1907219 RepID=A0A4P9Y645_9FUNG|nr:NUDIX hydrolase domain-like protein [Piptocephalis cylindrospora]|eukprot:RKP14445.1 NUDIX hydrolase domain-like protein [Piptocephalis cylindrospora]